MVQRPLTDEAGGLVRQGTMDDLAVGNPHESLEALIGRVEMGRRMIVMVHANDDAEEEGDDRHGLVVAAVGAHPKST